MYDWYWIFKHYFTFNGISGPNSQLIKMWSLDDYCSCPTVYVYNNIKSTESFMLKIGSAGNSKNVFTPSSRSRLKVPSRFWGAHYCWVKLKLVGSSEARERFEPFYVDVKGVQEVMASRKPEALWFMAHQLFMKVWPECWKMYYASVST